VYVHLFVMALRRDGRVMMMSDAGTEEKNSDKVGLRRKATSAHNSQRTFGAEPLDHSHLSKRNITRSTEMSIQPAPSHLLANQAPIQQNSTTRRQTRRQMAIYPRPHYTNALRNFLAARAPTQATIDEVGDLFEESKCKVGYIACTKTEIDI